MFRLRAVPMRSWRIGHRPLKRLFWRFKEPTVILIAGKGNETTQKVGNTYVSYLSDMAYAKKYIEEYDSIHGGE